MQGAIRYDQASSFSPAEGNGTQVTSRFNAAPISLERTEGVNSYRDISPRVGAAYNVFGNGKTAVKFNLGRYLAPATNDTIYTANNPSTRIVSTASRSWSDINKNFVVDCDLLNPAAQTAGGDTCGALTGEALNFGKLGGSTRVNPDLLKGWGVRPVDWQWGINVAAGARPARLAGGRLQPALVGELHGHRQHAGGPRRTMRSGPSSRRTIRACPTAAVTRSTSTR